MKPFGFALIGLLTGLAGGCALAIALGARASRPGGAGMVEESASRELETLRAENAALKRELSGHRATREEKPPQPPAAAPENDDARELCELLGREPTADELAALKQLLADTRRKQIEDDVRRIKEREAAAAALKAGDFVGVLRASNELSPAVMAVVQRAEAFGSWFERRIPGPNVDGSSLEEDTPIADGTTIRFGAGMQTWKVSHLGRHDPPFPKDLLIVGAGRDLTLLKIDEFNADTDIRSLTFQDLTLDCADNYMTDLRGETGSTIRFERCRIVRFDMGAGGSCMLSSNSGVAFFATDTSIVCGYGSSPGSGQVFRVSGALLVRMERCAVEGPMRGLFSGNRAEAYCFVQCAFTNVPDLYTLPKADSNQAAKFDGCSFSGSEEAEAVQLDLSEINLDWKD